MQSATTSPLKAALDEDGRRQTWLAHRLGVAPSQVCRWAQGSHIPMPKTQAAIAELLGRTVEALWPPETRERSAA